MSFVKFFASDAPDNSPSKLRSESFKEYFLSRQDISADYIFISMPPFRRFKLFFSKKKRVILDIRDGWSIAQASGYGENVRKKPLKAWLTRKVERLIIQRAFITITCTPGLQEYLQVVSDRKIILIPNGISDGRIQIINRLKGDLSFNFFKKDNLTFVCAGQFSEYGIEKVKQLLSVIVTRYGNKFTEIKIIGANEAYNNWIIKYYSDLSNGYGKVSLLPKMSEEELFRNMIEADYGLSIIRDPSYEFGTKVYDYIALGLPIVNYFDTFNNFTDYFDACFDVGFCRNSKLPEIRRSVLIEKGLKNVVF